MSKRRATGRPRPVGLTPDQQRLGVTFPTPQGDFIVEVPIDDLPAWQHLMAQLHDKAGELTGVEQQAIRLPVWKFEMGGGQTDEGPMIVLQFRVPGGGTYAFRLQQALAAQLRDKLDEAVALAFNKPPPLN